MRPAHSAKLVSILEIEAPNFKYKKPCQPCMLPPTIYRAAFMNAKKKKNVSTSKGNDIEKLNANM